MGRGAFDPAAAVSRIRAAVPGIALRSSIITGFPGETDKDFEALLDFVRAAKFEHLGVFAFSPEPGTRAARMGERPDPAVAEERRSILLEAQRGISKENLRRLKGRVCPVLVEGVHPETDLLLSGRLPTQAPEVDGSVLITRGVARQGEIVDARISATHDYDVEAEIVGPAQARETVREKR